EHESFSRAASAMEISLAKTSMQIRDLEQHLGVQLLSRTTSRSTPTEIGQAYYEHCKRILGDIAATEAVLSNQSSQPHGRLRIDASVTLVNRVLLPVIGKFRAQYPAIELEFLHTNHIYDSTQEGMDVMLRLGPLKDSRLIARPLARAATVTAAAPSYLAIRGI